MKNIITAIECASEPSNPGGFVTPIIRNGLQYILDAFEEPAKNGSPAVMLHLATGRVVIPDPAAPRPHKSSDYKMSLFAMPMLMQDPASAKIIKQTPWFLRQFAKQYPGKRIILYVGTIKGWVREFPATRQGQQDAWAMAERALPWWSKSKIVDLCFDEAGRLQHDSAYAYVIEQFRSRLAKQGRKIYIEPQQQSWSSTAGLDSIAMVNWVEKYGTMKPGGLVWYNGDAVNRGYDINEVLADCERNGSILCVNVQQIKDIKGFE